MLDLHQQIIECEEMNDRAFINALFMLLEGWRAAITVGTNDGPLTGLSNR